MVKFSLLMNTNRTHCKDHKLSIPQLVGHVWKHVLGLKKLLQMLQQLCEE